MLPISVLQGYASDSLALPLDSAEVCGQTSFQTTFVPQLSFGDANSKLLEQQIMYQQMLNDILYTSSVYSGWDNIPLYNISPMNLNLFSQNNLKNPFNINFDINTEGNENEKENKHKDKTSNKASLSLIRSGYDYIKGQKLANIARKNVVGFKKKCATYAKTDIQQAGLGKYEYGNATDCDKILDRNPNFKRVNISLEELKNTPGIVLVYKAGVSGYHKKYGHIEITGGDGCAYSDGRTRNIRPGFIAYAPVSKSSKSYTA